VLKSGSPEQQYEKLHKLYQTKALRIAPNELHITDVHQYKVIYGATTPFPKLPSFYNSFHVPHTVFVEVDPTLHKKRRQMLNPLFSRSGVFKLEPIIHEKVKDLLHQIDNLTGERTANLYGAFRHLTADIIIEFGFGKPPSIPEKNRIGFRLIDALEGFGQNIWTIQEWPLFNMISGMIPLPIMRHFNDGFGPMARLIKYGEVCLQEYEKGGYTKRHPIVFDHLLTLPYNLKIMEAVELLIAGSGTTASTLTSGLFHILQNKGIQARLTSAVQKVQPNEKGILPLSELEKIDYLVACAKESLRVGLAIPGRLPRVVPLDPKQPFVVDGKLVPPGTIVSLSAYTMHYSEELWGEDARSFNPDRWLGPDSKNLDQYLCTFSKGARMCLGRNLARRGKAASAPIVSEKANLPKSSAPKGSQRSVKSLIEDVNSHMPDFSFVDEGFAVSPDFTPGHANPPKSPALSAPRPSVTNLVGDFSYDVPNLTSIDDGLSLSTDSLPSRGSEARQMAGMPPDFGLPPLGSSLDFPLLSRIGHGGLNKRDVPVSSLAAIHSALKTLPQDPTKSQPDDKTLGTDGTGDFSASDSSANIHVLLSTLKSLYMPPMMPTPGLDMILKVTSRAVGNLSSLLKDPRGLNSSNIALLALVCCNSILDAHQQLLLIQRDPISASDDTDYSEGAMDCRVATTAITADMHIAVGEYLPENSVKQKIIFSVLLAITPASQLVEV
ncbi:hypothetical protein N8T08_001209, partial [Aspergillus melleus]